MEKILKTLPVGQIKPYERNPRKNDIAVDDVAESIRQTGYIAPIIIDENGEILAGHTRFKALKKLGKAEVEVLQVTGLTEEQKRKYRLLDNKTGERAGWDFELLDWELEDLDFEGWEFGFEALTQSFIDDLTEEAIGVRESNPLNTFTITLVLPKEHEGEIKGWFKENGQEPIIKMILKEVNG